jgi:hypothetical protein
MAGGHAATTIYHVADGVLAPALTPHGALVPEVVERWRGFAARFRRRAPGRVLLPGLSYWRELRIRYVTALCALPGLGDGRDKSPVPLPANDGLQRMAKGVPPMAGAQYLTATMLAEL